MKGFVNDQSFVEALFRKRHLDYDVYVNQELKEIAFVFDALSDKGIGYISHAMHFDKEGVLIGLSNWDYDNSNKGYVLIEQAGDE